MWVKLDGVKAYKSRGRVYAYCRLTGKPLKNTPEKRGRDWYGNEALILELAALRTTLRRLRPGSTAAMVEDYKQHTVTVSKRTAFCDLAPRTQADYATDMARLCDAKITLDDVAQSIGDVAPADLTLTDCRDLRDGWTNKYGPTQARRILRACSVLWSYGVEYDWVKENLWRALPLPKVNRKGKARANPPWTPGEFLIMLDTAPHIGLARAYVLAFLGIRPEQLITVTHRQLRTDLLAQKTGQEHHIHIPDALKGVFAGSTASVMATNQENGRPWKSYSQLRGAFNRHRTALSAAGDIRATLTLKGLNHTLGSALAESGATSKEMQAAMARSAQTVEHYSRRANNGILSRAAFRGLSGWLNLSNGEESVSNN